MHKPLSICLKNDSVKNHGFGTHVEQLPLVQAFDILGMENVYDDAFVKIKCSQHILAKAGFEYTHSKGIFITYAAKTRGKLPARDWDVVATCLSRSL